MTRTADYTIQGFIFQFNKTLLEILKDTQDAEIIVEGIIEDIEIQTPGGVEAIQCKYHEAQESYNLSIIYKPILQMMEHFHANPGQQINYRLHVHFPNETEGAKRLTTTDVNEIFGSTNKKLLRYINVLKGNVNVAQFINQFNIEFGKPLESLITEVCDCLRENGVPSDEIDTLIYPNAIHKIATISIMHDVSQRRVKKSCFLQELLQIRKTAISRWTRALTTYKKLLTTRKLQLKHNLDKNSRSRYFIIAKNALADFETNIVTFVDEYLDKYHFKAIHDKTPLFCLDCSTEEFNDILLRLHKKGIPCSNGVVAGTYFDETWFLRNPIIEKVTKSEFKKEFLIRLLQYSSDRISTINKAKCDDLFIVSVNNYPDLDAQDVNVELIAVENTLELKYILGMRDTYE